MSKRGMDAPLAEQMDRLKKSMHSRDVRRDQDREKRLVSKAGDDPYAQSTHSRSSTGGVSLGPGAAAQAAVLNAAALAGPIVIRCDLCQTDFRNQAMLRQHEEGPAHKKAVAREQAEREREAWATNPSAAANALQAAAWLNGGVTAKREPNYKPQSRESAGRGAGQSQASKGQPAKAASDAPAKPQGPSHAELIAQARKANEPVSINGWVPPSLTLPTASPAKQDADREIDSAEDRASGETEASLLSRDDKGVEQTADTAHEQTADSGAVKQAAASMPLLSAYGSSSEGESEEDEDEVDTDVAGHKPKFESFF